MSHSNTHIDIYEGETSSRNFYRQPQGRYIHDYRLLTNLSGGGFTFSRDVRDILRIRHTCPESISMIKKLIREFCLHNIRIYNVFT